MKRALWIIFSLLFLGSCTPSEAESVVSKFFDGIDRVKDFEADIIVLDGGKVSQEFSLSYLSPDNFIIKEENIHTFISNNNVVKYDSIQNSYYPIKRDKVHFNIGELKNTFWPLIKNVIKTYSIKNFENTQIDGVGGYKFVLEPRIPLTNDVLTITARQSDYIPVELVTEDKEVCEEFENLKEEFGIAFDCRTIIKIENIKIDQNLTNGDFNINEKFPNAKDGRLAEDAEIKEVDCPELESDATLLQNPPFSLPSQTSNFVFAKGEYIKYELGGVWAGSGCISNQLDGSYKGNENYQISRKASLSYHTNNIFYTKTLPLSASKKSILLKVSNHEKAKVVYHLGKKGYTQAKVNGDKEYETEETEIKGTKIIIYKSKHISKGDIEPKFILLWENNNTYYTAETYNLNIEEIKQFLNEIIN